MSNLFFHAQNRKVREPVYYTVTYFNNGGIGGPSFELGIEGGYIINHPAQMGISNGSREFVCWSTDDSGQGERYNPGDVIDLNYDITFFAIWT